jgi:hypothetical protein
MKSLRVIAGAVSACLLLGVLVPVVPAEASSVSGLAGRWEYVLDIPGCLLGCVYAADIVRLTIVDSPSGTLSGTWQEASCVANDKYFELADMDLPSNPPNGPAHATFAITGQGSPSSFTISVGTDTFSGGTGNLPHGDTGHGLWYPDYTPPGEKVDYQRGEIPTENSRPRLFLLTARVLQAAVFFPAIDYSPMGACGLVPKPKRASKH